MAYPKFEPTQEERDNVAALVAFGIEQEIIRQMVRRPRPNGEMKPISVPTLRKAFTHELGTGLALANSKVADSLYKKATSGKHPQAVTAAIFWLKTRAGWRDRIEVTGKDGAPIQLDLSSASEEELAVLERFFTKKAAKAASAPANDQAA